ncbi:MAG: tetratricopeptide repeat protein [Candidatus Levyibacteriota bacterium]
MKQKLPKSSAKTVALFPSNFRFITEYSFSDAQSRNIKIGLVSIVSLLLIALIFVQGVVIWYNMQQREVIAHQRGQLQQEVQYWKGIADKYKGYRDVYYRIALLQYRLGNTQESQQYVKKALELDPNFPGGHVLGAKIGL